VGSASYIGRVGGLAVALGLGAAVCGGTAVAWADSPSTGSSSTAAHPAHPHVGHRISHTSAHVRPAPAKQAVVRPASASAARVSAAASNAAAGGSPAAPADSPAALVQLAFTRRESVASAAPVQDAALQNIALIMSPSGVPIVTPAYLARVFQLYVQPNSPAGTLPQGLDTPEGLYPVTGVKSLPLNTSVDQGLQILDAAIKQQLAAGNSVTVFGYSQSSIISSLEMGNLDPSTPISFILTGNEMNPDGGLLARFPGLTLPSLGLDFYGSTPPDAFPTTNYTLEYDGFADFPRYPLNFLADLNAGLGIVFVHTKYANVTPTQVSQAIALPTTSATQHYYMMPTENLPLLQPLRALPLIGNPLADLVQPALKVLVNLGYGDPKYGWSTGTYANVSTPFGLFPAVNWGEVAGLLVNGAEQGVSDFLSDLGPGGSVSHEVAAFTSAMSHPLALPASPADVITGLQKATTQIAYTISNAAAAAYATLLPTADIINSFVTMLPSYDIDLFLSGISQAISGDPIGGLVNAVGLPIAADVGLSTTAVLIEALVLEHAVQGVLDASSQT
jgi:PE-PPE domain